MSASSIEVGLCSFKMFTLTGRNVLIANAMELWNTSRQRRIK